MTDIIKKALALIVALVAVVPASAQLLYRISGNGLQKDSYIFGSYHVADESFADSVRGAREALEAVEQVCGEISITDMMNPDSLAAMERMQKLPEGFSLKGVLGDDNYGKLAEAFKEVLGMDMLGMPGMSEQLDRVSPVTMSSMLTVFMCQRLMAGKGFAFNPQNGIDMYFQKKALEMGKGVMGFETIAFQMSVLHSDDMDEEVKALMCQVKHLDAGMESVGILIDAYYAQDLERTCEVIDQKFGDECDPKPEDLEKLIYSRNDNWMKLMPGIMADKPTLFVVGAGHLGSGERGVLAQLRKAGYSVEGVK